MAVLQRYAKAEEVSADRPTNPRFVYYQLKQDGYPLVKHAKRRDDQDVIDAVFRIRDVEAVPWAWLSDETRSVDEPIVAQTIAEWMAEAVDRARIEPWPEGAAGDHLRAVRCPRRAAIHRLALQGADHQH